MNRMQVDLFTLHVQIRIDHLTFGLLSNKYQFADVFSHLFTNHLIESIGLFAIIDHI